MGEYDLHDTNHIAKRIINHIFSQKNKSYLNTLVRHVLDLWVLDSS